MKIHSVLLGYPDASVVTFAPRNPFTISVQAFVTSIPGAGFLVDPDGNFIVDPDGNRILIPT